MGKLRVYTTTEAGTTVAFEMNIPALATVEHKEGEDALFEGATTNAQPVGPEDANPDDVSVFITVPWGDDLEKAVAENEKKQAAAAKKAEKEAAKDAGA